MSSDISLKKKLSASLLNIPTSAIKTLMLVDEYGTVISVTEFARLIGVFSFPVTVIILNIGTDRSEQTVQTQIRLLLMEQSDQGLLCLLFCLHLLNTILHCKIQLFQL